MAAGLLEVDDDIDVRALLPAILVRTAAPHREAGQAHQVLAGALGRRADPRGDPLTPLPRSSHLFDHGDWPAALGCGARPLSRAREPGAAAAGREFEVADAGRRGSDESGYRPAPSVAPRTAEAHVENIRRKLQVRSRAQIAAWVTEHRLRR